MKEQIINLDIYRRNVAILQGGVSEINEWLADHSVSHDIDWDNTAAVTFDDGIDVYVCSVKPMDLPTVCHELSHATFKILDIVGINATLAEEAYAYLFEYLVSRVTSSDGVPLQSSRDFS